ncbi:hypothetical protein NGB36_02065 [Streptomyces sp. RB6PN25]|uniref:Uncharacterized protein n=1 Tax=Streptomyces humicola TaxID=2953240 RepID=A0ABT1PS69_9ACTN|nr:hypothetical protein [Streptomyces humicola]MCQ4079415.1 hypothetical protein [Streptomyces humicola]
MAERLIDQFFVELVADAERWPDLTEQDKANAASQAWHANGTLNGITMIRVRMWASNRALRAFHQQK